MKYRCIKKCYFQERLFEEGDILNWREEGDPPHHFEVGEAVAPPIVQAEPGEASDTDTGKPNDLEALRKECDSLKIPYDRRWNRTKLEHTLTLAKRDKV
jgi:hypothetical protein